MKLISRKTVAAGVASLALLVVGGSALAFGAFGDQEEFLGDVASRLGVEQEVLADAIRDAQLAQVDEAEAEGRITEDEAAALRERIESAERPLLAGGGFRGGFGFRGGPGGFLEPAAETLGLTGAELRGQLPGTSLAAIAAEQGVSVQAVEDALVAARAERLDEAVADGRLTEAEATDKLERLESRVDNLVDRVFPEEGAFGKFGHGPPHADGGTDPAEESTAEEAEL